ncbi:Clr5 domain-containing protein [Schizothecium vesticola]|uniref:Clr5 domain-containing protein n=1 Tax=Schizothecium vesticola TaxID=314040 RepID=A0AA40KB79_9PEZI|nr:Clr5 domain-containing protein [Schizothecium vesticola]
MMDLPVPVPPRSTRAKPTPSATPNPDFTKHKETITDLYWRHDMPLSKVAEVMAKEYGFHASDRQYKKQFKAWNLDKNITKEESEAMYRLQRIRRRRGKERFRGRSEPTGLDMNRVMNKVGKTLSLVGLMLTWSSIVALPPTIRCETPKPRDICRILPNDGGAEEAAIFSPKPQPAASPFLLNEHHPVPEHGPWARPLSPQADWDVTDDVSFGDMLAAPAEADVGPPFSAAPVNHFAFEDPGPYPDFLADFEATSSSSFGSMPFGAPAPEITAPLAQHGNFMRPLAGWGTGNYDPRPSQGNPAHLNANENGLFNNALHTWPPLGPPSPAHPPCGTPRGLTPLHIAVATRSLPLIHLLLNAGAHFDCIPATGSRHSVLFAAVCDRARLGLPPAAPAESDDEDGEVRAVLAALVNHNPPVNWPIFHAHLALRDGTGGMTPLMAAAERGLVGVVRGLLRRFAFLDNWERRDDALTGSNIWFESRVMLTLPS